MLDFLIPRFSAWITHLAWYQYVGEIIASIFFVASFFTKRLISVPQEEKLILWKKFLRSSGFLLAFASIAIPWMISGLF